MTTNAITVNSLDFSFGEVKILKDLNIELKCGSRCLLIGANGAGKSTLLKVLAGKNLTKSPVYALGRNVFQDPPDGVTYLGTEWANNPVVRGDVPVARLLKTLGAERNKSRCAELLEIMDVNPTWNMLSISDGQRRRVQIVLGLLEPWNLLLLDEVTVDLDCVVRKNLLDFLIRETTERKATILYATHIFDGLGNWPTHIAHISDGHVEAIRDLGTSFPEMDLIIQQNQTRPRELLHDSPLLSIAFAWISKDMKKAKPIETGKTRWEELADNMHQYGDKFYNYYN